MNDLSIKVVAFGVARDIVGGNTVQLTLGEGDTVDQAMVLLKTQYPAFEQLASLKLAINEAYVDHDYKIKKGDELVIIPPVSGG